MAVERKGGGGAERGASVRPEAEARRRREAEALRANLKRRKEQERARKSPAGGGLPKGEDEKGG